MGLANIIDAVFHRWIKCFFSTRLLSKLAAGDEGQGATACSPAMYKEALEEASTGATPLFASAVEFLKKSIKKSHIELGTWGERMAAKELKKRGFKILYRNYRGPHGGEVDLVCRDRETLVFVEVKTRSNEKHSRPFDAVDQKKQKLVQRGALSWLRLLGFPDLAFRFDVVEVIATRPPEIRVIENAFQMPTSFRY
jgi:putative endonuclease